MILNHTERGNRMGQPKVTIAELRARNNKMKQSELAEAVGVSTQTIGAWEKDITIIKGEHLLKLCKILGTTASDLLGV
nr:MAG TPA: Helix-turn-helix XRE-family like protein [Caudoviricetes sp.]